MYNSEAISSITNWFMLDVLILSNMLSERDLSDSPVGQFSSKEIENLKFIFFQFFFDNINL